MARVERSDTVFPAIRRRVFTVLPMGAQVGTSALAHRLEACSETRCRWAWFCSYWCECPVDGEAPRKAQWIREAREQDGSNPAERREAVLER